jgi:dipeptidyl aminopeptidase/acylaminoacyl peptidase
MEIPVQFTHYGQKIFGMLHIPDPDEASPAVVIYHGFTGSHMEAHFFFAKLSRALSRAGIASLRIDFRGSGNSEGDFRDMSIGSEVEDGLAAVDFLCKQKGIDPERIGVAGLSLGGCVAAIVSGREPRVKSTVLMSAVAVPDEDFAPIIPPLDPIEEDRNAVAPGDDFRESLKKFRPLEEIKKTSSKVLVIHGTDDESIPCSRAEDYRLALLEAQINHRVDIIPKADHTYAKKVHEDDVIRRLVDWYLDTL